MWEFEMCNKKTKEINIVFGYSLSDVRKDYPENEWVCNLSTYVD